MSNKKLANLSTGTPLTTDLVLIPRSGGDVRGLISAILGLSHASLQIAESGVVTFGAGTFTITQGGSTLVFSGSIQAGGFLKTIVTTVGALPAAAGLGAGWRAMVSDANATTFNSIVAAGGANTVPVFTDASNWRIG